MTTRRAILIAVADKLGWHTGTSLGTATTTSVVLPTLVGATGRDNEFREWRLDNPDQAVEADQSRVLTEWDDSDGLAVWVDAQGGASDTADDWLLSPKGEPTLAELRSALNAVLVKTKRVVLNAVPTVNDRRFYHLHDLDWLRSRDDVLRAFYRASPNLVDNGQFDNWSNGPALAPARWVLAGTDGTIARSTSNVARGAYTAAITRSGTDVTLTQTMSLLDLQLQGETITAELHGLSEQVSSLTLGINDGTATTTSTAHDGGGAIDILTVSRTLSADATTLQVIVTVAANGTSYAGNVVAVDGSSIPTALSDTGDQAYRLQELNYIPRDIGGAVTIELPRPKSRGGQLVVASLQPFPELTADTGDTDMDITTAVSGVLYELASRRRRGEDRERWDAIATQHGPAYALRASRLMQVPVPESNTRVIVGPA